MNSRLPELVVLLLAMCCPPPLFDKATPSQGEGAFDAAAARIWAGFALGVAFLTLSFWSAVWLVLALIR